MKQLILRKISSLVILLAAMISTTFAQGEYSCVDIIVASTVDKIKLTHETSLTSIIVSETEDGVYNVSSRTQDKKLEDFNITEVVKDSKELKKISAFQTKKLHEEVTSYGKLEMSFFVDANKKEKILVEGLTVVNTGKDDVNPRGFKFSVECVKVK